MYSSSFTFAPLKRVVSDILTFNALVVYMARNVFYAGKSIGSAHPFQ
jgi:hypothetical protein